MSSEQVSLLSEQLRRRSLSNLTLSKDVIEKLQRMLDKRAKRAGLASGAHECRFILALNDLSKVATALRSRLFTIDFTVRQANTAETKLRLHNWYGNRLAELGFSFERERLDHIVTLYFPDFRQIANALGVLHLASPRRSNWNANGCCSWP
jgi:DNA polymerase III delta subunit